MNGPSGTPAPTGCVYLGAPVFGKPPIWTQQSRCTITDRRVSARCVGAAAGMGYKRFDAEPFCTVVGIGQGKSKNRWFLAAFLHPFAAVGKRNMAAGGIEKKVVGPLRPKVTRARGAEYPSPEAWGKRKATGRRGRRPLRGASIWVRRKMRTGCGAKKARSAVDRTRCAIGVGGGESRRCHSAGTK